MKKPICKNCTNWKSEQAELEYSTFYGICTCFAWAFNSIRDNDVVVLDRNNLSTKHMNIHRFESQKNEIPFGDVDESKYCLVTNYGFRCIHYQERKKGD